MLENAADPNPPRVSSPNASQNDGINGIATIQAMYSIDPPTISTRPLIPGSFVVNQAPPRAAPNASAAARTPTSVGDTLKICRPIGAIRALYGKPMKFI